jgi:osmotically-inducible protein OsmY
MKHLIQPAFTLLLAASVSGCAVATAGVKKGDERNLARSVQDGNAARVIRARMKRAYDYDFKGVDVEVAQSIVLLSGRVPTQKDKIEAARIAWSARGIEQVGNEVLVDDGQSFKRNLKDGILEKSVRARMTVDKYVKARNFNIETNEGVVYVLGVARTEAELKRAAQIAATTKGAKQVVSYARIANLPSTNSQRALPSILQTAPSYEAQLPAPITNAPMGQPIPFAAPTAPREIQMGDRLGKELPSDEELGAYRTGQAGEAVSIIESAPYYIDPDTGKEIPIRFDADGNIVPLIIR